MSKIAVVFWTGTGNTSTMATAIVEGIKEAGAEAELIAAADFGAAKVKEYDGIAFGCPAMGDEVLEESEFAPMFDECKPELTGKKVALFGSYGWGTGEWMENWEADCAASGIKLGCLAPRWRLSWRAPGPLQSRRWGRRARQARPAADFQGCPLCARGAG